MLEGEDGAPFRAGPQCPLQGRLTRCAQPLSLRWVFRDASARGQSTETGRKRQSLAIVILRLVLCVLNLAFYRAKIEATRRGLPAHEVAAAVRAILAKPAAAFRALGERRDPMMRAGGGTTEGSAPGRGREFAARPHGGSRCAASRCVRQKPQSGGVREGRVLLPVGRMASR